MRIALHTPLNEPDDGRLSGDRTMARQLVMLLEHLGHGVLPIRDARSYLAEPDEAAMGRLEQRALAQVERLLSDWRDAPPDLVLTYHGYYKSPDLIGPALARALGIPYALAEASDAPKRLDGPWARFAGRAREAIAAADLHIAFTERDAVGLRPLMKPGARLLHLPPFLAALPAAPADRVDRPARLLTVAMMRPGAKAQSYDALSAAMARLRNADFTLTVVGDGPGRDGIERRLRMALGKRVTFAGALTGAALDAAYAAHDLFVWPGIGEAYGLVYLEAQAAGLPVVAFASAGVPEAVRAGETALLAPEREEQAFDEALIRLIGDAALRRSMGADAKRFIETERSLDAAAGRLGPALAAPRTWNLPPRSGLDRLAAELDAWAGQRLRAPIWLRDDDAIAPSAALDRLDALCADHGAQVLLAVIALQATDALAERLAASGRLVPCQHGASHANHAPPDAKKAEFGAHRPLAAMQAEIATGRQRLRGLFGDDLLDVFVPAWNRIDPDLAERLPDIGLTDLSCFANFSLRGERPLVVNTHVDLMDWRGGRMGKPAEVLADELAAVLAARRAAARTTEPVGLLLHHRDHDAAAWDSLSRLLGLLSRHAGSRLCAPRELFCAGASLK